MITHCIIRVKSFQGTSEGGAMRMASPAQDSARFRKKIRGFVS